MNEKVLIVDDVEINRAILREYLYKNYEIEEASNGSEAIKKLFDTSKLPQAILLDIMMPEIDGFELLKIIKSNPKTDKIPVLFITAADASTNESRCLNAGAVDYISKPFNPDVVKARVNNHIQLSRYKNELETIVEEKTAEAGKIYEQTLETLATIIEHRNLESGIHIRRTGELCKILIAHMLKMPEFKYELVTINHRSIVKAVALHDIGKIGISDSILLKPGKLTDEEFEIMKQHSSIGSDIIETISTNLSDDGMYLKRCKEICRHHHERWDRKGYPDGLYGKNIPLAARITTVVDVYDALVNLRCYKPAFTHEAAVDILKDGAGTQFDPEIINAFLTVEEKFHELEQELADTITI